MKVALYAAALFAAMIVGATLGILVEQADRSAVSAKLTEQCKRLGGTVIHNRWFEFSDCVFSRKKINATHTIKTRISQARH